MADTDSKGETFYGVGRLKIDERQLTSLILAVLIVEGLLLSYWVVKQQWANSILQLVGILPLLGILYIIKGTR
jgi:Zn-dependent protease with chaperone function